MVTLKQFPTPSSTQEKLYPNFIEKEDPNHSFVAPAISQLEFISANLTNESVFTGFPSMYLESVINNLKAMLHNKELKPLEMTNYIEKEWLLFNIQEEMKQIKTEDPTQRLKMQLHIIVKHFNQRHNSKIK